LYEWDFDGNGTHDWSSTTTGSAAQQYSTVGVFNAQLRVTDDEDETDTDICRIDVSVPPPVPVVTGWRAGLLALALGAALLTAMRHKR